MRTLLYLIIAFTGFHYFRKLSTADRLDWFIKGIRTKGGILNLTLFLNIDIINKTAQAVKFNFLKADIHLNGDIVGQIDYTTPIDINPGITKIEVPIRLKPLFSVTQLLAKLKDLNLNFITKGIINFEGVNFEVYEKINLL